MPDSPDRLTQQVFLSVLFQRKKRRVRNSVTHTVYRPRETGPQPPENVSCNSVLYATRKHVIQAHNPLKMFSAVLLCGQNRTHVILAHNPPKMFSAVLPCTRKLFCPVQYRFSGLYKEAFLACTRTLFCPVQRRFSGLYKDAFLACTRKHEHSTVPKEPRLQKSSVAPTRPTGCRQPNSSIPSSQTSENNPGTP